MTSTSARQAAVAVCAAGLLAACTGSGPTAGSGAPAGRPAGPVAADVATSQTRAAAAAFASDVLATAVELGPEDRARWLTAHVPAQSFERVRDFLDRWVDQLGGGDALPGVTDPRLSITTLDFVTRAEREVPGGQELRLALIQQVSRLPDAGDGRTVYVRTEVVVRMAAQGPVLVQVLGVGEIPQPAAVSVPSSPAGPGP